MKLAGDRRVVLKLWIIRHLVYRRENSQSAKANAKDTLHSSEDQNIPQMSCIRFLSGCRFVKGALPVVLDQPPSPPHSHKFIKELLTLSKWHTQQSDSRFPSSPLIIIAQSGRIWLSMGQKVTLYSPQAVECDASPAQLNDSTISGSVVMAMEWWFVLCVLSSYYWLHICASEQVTVWRDALRIAFTSSCDVAYFGSRLVSSW